MKKLLALLLLLFTLAACAGAPDITVAPDVRHGEDICERCGMIISDDRYSAAYWTNAGESRAFDDIGGMLAYHMENHEDVGSFWVHDYNTRDFVAAESTYLVLSDMHTPMGFGIAACVTEAEAEELAAGEENALVLTFDDALERLEAGELLLDPERRHNQEDG